MMNDAIKIEFMKKETERRLIRKIMMRVIESPVPQPPKTSESNRLIGRVRMHLHSLRILENAFNTKHVDEELQKYWLQFLTEQILYTNKRLERDAIDLFKEL